jgi:hypothetical protein
VAFINVLSDFDPGLLHFWGVSSFERSVCFMCGEFVRLKFAVASFGNTRLLRFWGGLPCEMSGCFMCRRFFVLKYRFTPIRREAYGKGFLRLNDINVPRPKEL